ncbi:MAG: DUF4125 family protein [Lachnospiraceae bacterium]|nr:DUF4125 family protein [Lachnospiraceae bacterium]
MKNELINQIIEMEWDMFQKTQNVGGRAWCQDDYKQFDGNRRAQFESWDEKTLQLYLKDLQEAERAGQNLVTLKYAYMMETTSPLEYLRLKDQLPEIDAEKRLLIDRMAEMTASWCEEFAAAYPNLGRHGRPARSEADAPGITSAQTYCRGELSTYSLETLKSLYEVYERYAEEHTNLFERSVESEMKFVWNKSLKEIETEIGL